jgi:hypothetical protein
MHITRTNSVSFYFQPYPPPRGCILVQKKSSCCPYLSCTKYHVNFYKNSQRNHEHVNTNYNHYQITHEKTLEKHYRRTDDDDNIEDGNDDAHHQHHDDMNGGKNERKEKRINIERECERRGVNKSTSAAGWCVQPTKIKLMSFLISGCIESGSLYASGDFQS